jgi:large subunit ribosomal protein L13
MMKTYAVKQGEIKRAVHVVDAKDKILGRVATEIATLLMGKHKAMFSRAADVGDIVNVINAGEVQVTGKKAQQKMYYSHSNYPGGFKQISYERLMVEHPDRIIIFAVDGMIPKNHLHDRVMRRLNVYPGPEAVETKVVKPVAPKVVKRAVIRNIPVEVKKVAPKSQAKR